MSYRISYKVTKQELEQLDYFSRLIGVPLETIAKKALFMAITDAYRRSKQMMEQEDKLATSAEDTAVTTNPEVSTHVTSTESDHAPVDASVPTDSADSAAPQG